MRNRFVLALAFSFVPLVLGTTGLLAQANAEPDQDPSSNLGALKAQIETGCGYSAHSGNGTRSITDLRVPGGVGDYGLDFVRYYNSLRNDRYQANSTHEPEQRIDFGAPGWSHSWNWSVNYAESIEQPGGDGIGPQIYTTSITITFPDGHANKYKIVRAVPAPEGQWWPPDGRCGAPYYAERGERNWPPAGEGIGDHLQAMAENGSSFWLYRADGGAVRFEETEMSYQATEVYDPHGLRTTLHYDANGYLDWVEQDGGRRLIFRWDTYCDPAVPGHCRAPVIGRVEREGSGGQQAVEYRYSWFDRPGGGSWLTLTEVIYPNEPVVGQTVSARYTYGDYAPPLGFGYGGPLLLTADDPHYAGPMKYIRYEYALTGCRPQGQPDPPYPGGKLDYFYASPTAIKAEKSGRTSTTVSRFVLGCFDGTRTEHNGLGGLRKFFYGRSAGAIGIYASRGYHLAKLTDFTTDFPLPPGLTYQQQNYLSGQPRQVWDGRGIMTEFVHTDDTGFPSEVRHIGSDGSIYRYDRGNESGSEARDTTRVPNTFDRWLFSETDERNQTTVYTRDSRRRVTRVDHPGGSFETFAYDNYGLNKVTAHRLTSGAILNYVYDSRGLLQREWNTVDLEVEETRYTYYGPGNQPQWTDLVETVQNSRARQNGKAFSAKMEYNGRGQITKVTYPATDSGADPFVTYDYDLNGNCISIRNELGHVSYYTYDHYGRCTSYTEPLNAPGWDGTGNVASRRWDWVYDRRINGVSYSASAHTSKEWRAQIEPASNSAGDRRMTAREHDLQNRIVVEQTGWIQPGSQPLGNWYAGPDLETHRYTYDKNGQKETFTDPRDRVTTYVYDLRNRLWKTIEPLNRITETNYDPAGNKTLVKFPDLTMQRWEDYDAFGQAWKFFDERNNLTDLSYQWGPMKKLDLVRTYRAKDGGGTETQPTDFDYDGLGRPTQTRFPDATTEISEYDFGQLTAWKTRRNQTKRLTYDARGREDYHTWDNGAAAGVDREWDAANRLLWLQNSFSKIDYTYDQAGQVRTEGTTVAGSNGMGSGMRKDVNYFRYPSGEISQLTYPNGTAVNRFYTGRGQLSSVGWGVGSTSYVYHPDGKVNYQARTNQVTTSYGYDGRGMISSVSHQKNSQSLAFREYWRDYRDRIVAWKRGSGGGLNGMEDGRGDRYAYDPEGQLYQASYRALNPQPGGTMTEAKRSDSFSYDALGNRQGSDNLVASRGTVNFTRRDNGLNQYLNWTPSVIYHDDNHPNPPGPPVWVYPANGVMMAEGWITASYNALNQPVAMWCPAYGSNYLWFGYDPLGRCVKRWMGPVTANAPGTHPATYFYYDGWNLAQEGPNASTADRLYVHGGRVDEIVASQVGGQWYNHHYDARGHCTLLTNTSGVLEQQYDYDAFGFPYFYTATGAKLNASAVKTRFLFTGREWLNDLRVYDYRKRVYQPELGRFLQPDPLQFEAGDYNLYRYCHNDPVNKFDPFGLATEVELQTTPVSAGYLHVLVQLRDTETGETMIARAGPSETYRSKVDAVLNNTEKSVSGNGNIKLKADMDSEANSADADNRTPVAGSATTVKKDFGAVKAQLNKLNRAINRARIDYTPQKNNSNAYAGTVYKAITGKGPPKVKKAPGLGHRLRVNRDE